MTFFNHKTHRHSQGHESYAIAQEAKNSIDQTLAQLNCNRLGLTQDDAQERLAYYGANQVAHEKAPMRCCSCSAHSTIRLFSC
ncbi:hypothetical protein GGER_33200 [Serratia rubidaea]